MAYSNESKENILGVLKGTLIEHGAVSEETALEMAQCVSRIFNSDMGISITGIAGPGGGTDIKPVGLVWIGFSSGGRTYAKKYQFSGNRNEIRKSASDAALYILTEELLLS